MKRSLHFTVLFHVVSKREMHMQKIYQSPTGQRQNPVCLERTNVITERVQCTTRAAGKHQDHPHSVYEWLHQHTRTPVRGLCGLWPGVRVRGLIYWKLLYLCIHHTYFLSPSLTAASPPPLPPSPPIFYAFLYTCHLFCRWTLALVAGFLPDLIPNPANQVRRGVSPNSLCLYFPRRGGYVGHTPEWRFRQRDEN